MKFKKILHLYERSILLDLQETKSMFQISKMIFLNLRRHWHKNLSLSNTQLWKISFCLNLGLLLSYPLYHSHHSFFEILFFLLLFSFIRSSLSCSDNFQYLQFLHFLITILIFSFILSFWMSSVITASCSSSSPLAFGAVARLICWLSRQLRSTPLLSASVIPHCASSTRWKTIKVTASSKSLCPFGSGNAETVDKPKKTRRAKKEEAASRSTRKRELCSFLDCRKLWFRNLRLRGFSATDIHSEVFCRK